MSLLENYKLAYQLGVKDPRISEERQWVVNDQGWHNRFSLNCRATGEEVNASILSAAANEHGNCHCIDSMINKLFQSEQFSISPLLRAHRAIEEAERAASKQGGAKPMVALDHYKRAESYLERCRGSISHEVAEALKLKVSDAVKKITEELKNEKSELYLGIIGKELLGLMAAHKEGSRTRRWIQSSQAEELGVKNTVIGSLWRTWSSRAHWDESELSEKFEKALTHQGLDAVTARTLSTDLIKDWEGKLARLDDGKESAILYHSGIITSDGDAAGTLIKLQESYGIINQGLKRSMILPRFILAWVLRKLVIPNGSQGSLIWWEDNYTGERGDIEAAAVLWEPTNFRSAYFDCQDAVKAARLL